MKDAIGDVRRAAELVSIFTPTVAIAIPAGFGRNSQWQSHSLLQFAAHKGEKRQTRGGHSGQQAATEFLGDSMWHLQGLSCRPWSVAGQRASAGVALVLP